MQKQAKKAKLEFEKDFRILELILSQYPTIFEKETFSYDNCKWIYVHLVSRCFGNYFKYVTMVPFAEFLNHECTDVYYDFKYNVGNPMKKEESDYPEPMELTEVFFNQSNIKLKPEREDATTSEGTYNSNLGDTDDDFDYLVEMEKNKEITNAQLSAQ